MAEQVAYWKAADGKLFDTQAEAETHEHAAAFRVKIAAFLVENNISQLEAADVAVLMSKNLGWFRTVMDDAAAKMYPLRPQTA